LSRHGLRAVARLDDRGDALPRDDLVRGHAVAGRARLRAAHELGEERDPVTGLEGRIERVGDAEHGVVHEHLDVLTELAPVPERRGELRIPRRLVLEETLPAGAAPRRVPVGAPARSTELAAARGPGAARAGRPRVVTTHGVVA